MQELVGHALGTQAWNGHLPVTRARLTSILERVVHGAAQFTLAERVLVTACEFWALAMAGELHTQSEKTIMGKLRFAAMVYESIGADGVASALATAHGDLARMQAKLQRKQRLQQLEAELLGAAQAMDALLARFAQQLDADDKETLRVPVQRDRKKASTQGTTLKW